MTLLRPPLSVGDFADGGEGASVTPLRRRRIVMRLVVAVLALALAIVAGTAFALWRVQSTLDAKIARFGDPFASIPASERVGRGLVVGSESAPGVEGAGEGARQAPAGGQGADVGEEQAVNLLVFGSDSRISAGDPSQWVAGAQRTDAIMLVHIPANRARVYVVSLPRDSWVTVPGNGQAKLNAAFSLGGPALAIRTVEQFTKVPIDHMVITDFQGFARLTDLLGGVDIEVEETTQGDTFGVGENFTAGLHHMDGETALTYVRQRYVLPQGDFDRVKRQQNWIRSVISAAVDAGVQTDPRRVYELLDAMASSLSTDSGFTMEKMRSLALSLRHVGPGGAAFLTAPVQGTGTTVDGQSIVQLDLSANAALWEAVRRDALEDWLNATRYDTLGESVR